MVDFIVLSSALDSTGLGLFKVFVNIIEKKNKLTGKQIYALKHRAACMQGQYSELRTHIQKENSNPMCGVFLIS